MKRRDALRLGMAALAGLSFPAMAQSDGRVRRIGFHSAGSSRSNAGWLDAFRAGMKQLGWNDGRDFVIDARFADGFSDAVTRLAKDLVATQPDLLLCPGDASARALANATKTIPIVFVVAADPVGNGVAKTLQRPGGNLTGLTSLSRDLTAKRLQLLKETFPKTSHVMLLYEPAEPSGLSQLTDTKEAAALLKLRLSVFELRRPDDIALAFDRGIQVGADAYVISSGFMVAAERNSISSGLVRAKAPGMASSSVLADAGVLMSYSPFQLQLFRQAAAYVDKIFKGASPADLPIEQPTKFELVVNVKTAAAIGAVIPSSVLLRADRVIE